MSRSRHPFAVARPCRDCPFTRDAAAVRLTRDRVREIAGNALSWDGRSFSCHATVNYDGERPRQHNAAHCAGSLIFSLKHGVETQMMRIAERLQLFDARRLRGQSRVFDSLDEMLATALDASTRRAAKAKRTRQI